jgi:hypothetical protein
MVENKFNAPPRPRRSLWMPIAVTVFCSFTLGATTCAFGLRLGKDGFGGVLLQAGLLCLSIFLLSLVFAAVYFVVWVVHKMRAN